MNLFELTEQQKAIQNLINEYAEANDGDITGISDLIDEWSKEFSVADKVESMCYLIKEFEARADARKTAGNDLIKKAKQDADKAERITKWMQHCLEASCTEKIKAGLFDVSIRTAGVAPFVLYEGVNLTNTPVKYIKSVHSVDLAKIKEDAKNGITEAFELGRFGEKSRYLSIK